MTEGHAKPVPQVQVEVLGHLIFYLRAGARAGTIARATAPVGTAVSHLPELLGIPKHEIQAVLVNGTSVSDPSHALGAKDQVVILPVISGG